MTKHDLNIREDSNRNTEDYYFDQFAVKKHFDTFDWGPSSSSSNTKDEKPN